jgi:hypothetical protein
MKKFIFIASAILFPLAMTFAQQEKQTARFHQAGITFSSFNAFGLQYKTGKDGWRFRGSLISINYTNAKQYGRDQDSLDIKSQSGGFGLRFGFEKPLPVISNFSFLLGVEAGCSYSSGKYNPYYDENTEMKSSTVSPGIYIVFGAEYMLTPHWILGAEIRPGVEYEYSVGTTSKLGNITREVTEQTITGGLNSGAAALSVAFRF